MLIRLNMVYPHQGTSLIKQVLRLLASVFSLYYHILIHLLCKVLADDTLKIDGLFKGKAKLDIFCETFISKQFTLNILSFTYSKSAE